MSGKAINSLPMSFDGVGEVYTILIPTIEGLLYPSVRIQSDDKKDTRYIANQFGMSTPIEAWAWAYAVIKALREGKHIETKRL